MSAQMSQLRQKPSIDKAAQDRVAQMTDTMRQQHGLPKLKRRAASTEEVQLVCTAAVNGASVHEPRGGALEVYSTDDPSQISEPLKIIAFGTTYESRSGTRRLVYSDNEWPGYDVVVYAHAGAGGARTFTVGVSRRSRMNDFFGWMTFDRPVSDSTDWKKQIAPECTNQHP